MQANPYRIREAAAVVVLAHFKAERNERGDAFATESEMRSIESDPLGWLSMLRGKDAYRLFERIL